jgi:hypothetical protein
MSIPLEQPNFNDPEFRDLLAEQDIRNGIEGFLRVFHGNRLAARDRIDEILKAERLEWSAQ